MKKIILLLTFISLINKQINSQIIYSGIIDTTIILTTTTNLPNDTVRLDLNSDNKIDIVFAVIRKQFTRNNVPFISTRAGFSLGNYPDTNKTSGTYKYIQSLDSTIVTCDTINENSEICDSNLKDDSRSILSMLLEANGVALGRFGNFSENEHFLGIKFYDSLGNVYYGRIKLTISENCDSITIHSWEYEASGKCINASKINENRFIKTINYSIQNGILIFRNDQHNEITKGKICDINGKELTHFDTKKDTRINISNLKNGIYILILQNHKNQIYSEKFTLIH